ncbi:MAG: lipoprotein signal peptidase [Dysgonamonadaceae bacterium]|jgi:signal peptidase II|nr:lipoprotein signal peptidase [Dysgonamonadaceae bacterium]
MKSKAPIAVAVILTILLIDQTVKIVVKTNMKLLESIEITEWCKIYFVENNGIAMGIDVFNKTAVSIFRITSCILIACYLVWIVRKKHKTGYIVCIAMIFAGAVGNIIDSVFYGVAFGESTPSNIATFLPPEGGGYGSWLNGKVVDMFYFPIFSFNWAQNIPVIGGKEFEFFCWVFNVADASITVGLGILIIFYRKTFGANSKKRKIKIQS